ncbi:MAG: pyridoxal 5'-phosphate synthase glutaminase subunit PdxT [Ilumatobacter sp.]|nr:pyridoxal 5'-phosphate synthase glutaminase subunit PdxT [Ilumatobacter sp.]MDG1696271.1 pyridoxal 5'-phosphate synthase glutaminase subunit PdxT [Ilumatobacter sp.]MDG2439466.1 pyridoxal 5'-phosphate synthase glutaminase subunit PdxT [Ilumatobacter sp.]
MNRSAETSGPVVGVLALQGAFSTHLDRLASLNVKARLVTQPEHLKGVDALILPGGESTTMSMLLDTSGLREPLGDLFVDGMPVFGTCAGMILCASNVLDGRPDQRGFDLVDVTVRRNGYGRQLDSFETDLNVAGLASPFHAVFIRAPRVEHVGAAVDILATHDGVPVLVRDGTCTVAAFHPELTHDTRLHELFVAQLNGN